MIFGVRKYMDNIRNYFKGWIIGNFEPSILKSNELEIGIKKYKKGDKEEKHYHKIADEYTIVISGKIKMNQNEVKKGEIYLVKSGTENQFESITNSIILVIKTPSIPGDKYLS